MFLATKLYLPPLQSGTVQRDRLYNLLDAGWAGGMRLALLSAPPGYGKTTLLSGWIQARQLPCAWISLDTGDNDPARFFSLLLHALDDHIPGLKDLLPVLNLPQAADFENLAIEIINRSAQSDAEVLLALDDYHAITSNSVQALVQLLLNRLPPKLRLAVLTREDPPFNLPQLRARRQMLEIRARELTFSGEEGYSLLVQTQGLVLDDGQVDALLERTEGWAAGLQLAALTLHDHPQPTQFIDVFNGSHPFILDYLVGEVLEKLPPNLGAFLRRSAVLDRLNADLCDAALELENSRALIARATAANLFLIPLDDQRTWFRYHHLMAEILKAEVTPADRQGICRRAALWFHERQQALEAVHYALEARLYDLAGEVIRSAALPAAENGQLTTALGWLDALPQEILLSNPDLCVFRAWFLLFNGRFLEAAAWVRSVAELAQDLPPPLAGLLTGLQAWMRMLWAQKLDPARLKEAYAMTEGKFPYFSPMLLMAIGQAQRETGDWAGALKSFEEAAALAEVASGPVSALIIRNNQAFLLNEIGERQAAQQLCLDGIEQNSAPDGKPGLLAGIPLLPYGCFLYESGQVEEAYTVIIQALNQVRRLGLYEVLTTPVNHTLAYLLADQGRLEEALSLNKEVRRLGAKAGLQVVVNEAELVRAWLHLTAGDYAPARRWAQANPLPDTQPSDPRDYRAVMLHARVLSFAGQGEQAVSLLLSLLQHLDETGWLVYWIRGSVELALVYLALGESQKAFEVIVPAVERAAAVEYRQVFRRNIALLAPLLEKLLARFPQFIQSLGVGENQATPTAPDLIEQPGERELEILRLVSAGLSNAEIADRLFITVGTVKWHLNQLFGKLGVNRRTEAVAKARELGLF